MCILFWTVDNHPKYKFVFAGNRDEVLGRPTKPAHIWPTPNDNGKVIGGTDLDQKATTFYGTWLGMTTSGRLAALTNFREPQSPQRHSRGILVRDFLIKPNHSVHDYLTQLQTTADQFGGYSLICFDLNNNNMAYFSNRDKEHVIQPLDPGKIYGLSNSVLTDPWVKVKQGKGEMETLLKDNTLTEHQLIESFFQLLRVTKPFTDPGNIPHLLQEFKERIFIPLVELNNTAYGTRTSTVILVDKQDNVTFVERDWYKLDDTGTYYEHPVNRIFTFQLNHPHIGTTE
ncbi:NRDE protein-domain-containing protein [Chlamydoabsidia padenii]|nr:NRDE protein-domain-containing protein [Chlamydoabsidia padenii]